MSGRTALRFATVGLLAAALAAPAVAQQRAEAPMPRAKAPAAFAIELEFMWYDKEPVAVAPMPRAKTSPDELDALFRDLKARRPDLRLFAGYDVVGLGLREEAVPPMPQPVPPEFPVLPMTPPAPPAFTEVTPGVRFVVPQLGPLPQTLDVNFPVVPASGDNKQIFNFSVGVFGSQCKSEPVCPASLTGGFGSYCAPAVPRLVAPAQAQFLRSEPLAWTPQPAPLALPVAPRCGTSMLIEQGCVVVRPLVEAAPANALCGTWYRELPGIVIAATFTHDELKLCVTQTEGGHTATITLTAHYALTKDGLVYGAITGGDVDMKSDPKAGPSPFGMGSIELSMVIQALVDAPFSVRTKATSAGLMVSGARCGLPNGGHEAESVQLFGGLFKSAKNGTVPAPVSAKTTRGGKCDSGFNPSDCPVAAPTNPYPSMPVPQPPGGFERIGIDFSTNPPTRSVPAQPVPCPPQPVGADSFGPPFLSKIPYLNQLFQNVGPVAPPCQLPMPQPVRPAGCGIPDDSSKSMAAEAFTQLLQPVMGGMTLPRGRYEPYPQYFAPDPAFPLPRELASQEDPADAVRRTSAPPAKAAHLGTWCRDVAGKQCVVKVSADHLTLTVTEAHDENGKVTTASLVFTADYHLTRDGMTAVGLITSVDVSFEGDFPQEDTKPFFDMLTELQKALEDKPFALTFRVYDQSLVIGNVRMPTVGDSAEVQPAGYMAGRFKTVGRELPKPKPIKAGDKTAVTPTWSDPMFPERYNVNPPRQEVIAPFAEQRPNGSPLPPGYTPVHTGAGLLPPQAIPAPPSRVVPSSGTAPSVPPMSEPVKPVPQMPEPVPPGEPKAEGKALKASEMAVGWQPRIAYLPDPTRGGRMSPGLAGQMFLFGGPRSEFVLADGTLTLDLVDETPRPAGQPAATPERWQFDKDALTKLVTQNDTFGKCYTLFLPWPAYKADITKVKITARYDPESGHTLFSTPSTVTLEPAKAESPQMPQPVPPGAVGEAAPRKAPAGTFVFRYKAQQYSNDPNVRMQQLLYQ